MRFETSEDQLRASGRQSRGVKSMSMRQGDVITDMVVVPATEAAAEQTLVAVTKCGYGKRMRTSLFRCQTRGGKGVIAIKFKRADDRLLALSSCKAPAQELADGDGLERELLLITAKGVTVRQRLSAISEQGRATTGVLLQKLD